MPALSYLSALLKPQVLQPLETRGTTHLLMGGINESVFLGQWGMPEIKVGHNDLKSYFVLDLLTINVEITQNVTAWIYEKRDRVLFFRGEKLISHFKWSQFKKRFRRPGQRGFGSHDPSVVSKALTGTNPFELEKARMPAQY